MSASPTEIANPVVRGVNPDPSACRVGGDYFLATSTLEFWPGIPIRHSTDLVHWDLIGHAITRPEQYRRDGRPGPLKLYAPTLRHHDGQFVLACTNVAPGQGNFLVTADDPAGPWSDAVWVDSDAFDPSVTFDGDDAYYTRRTVVAGKEGSGPVAQAEIDISSGRLITGTRAITPGEAGYRSNDIEGPHLYRIGDWWYLFSAEGGTWKGHMQTVARSRSPWGPFEGNDRNPVLTHRHRVGHPIQSTGHAELLDDVRGNWWAVFLGTRHHAARPWHHLGRETFLAPVTWVDDWPVVGRDGTVEMDHPSPHPLPDRGAAWRHEPTGWTAGWSTRERPLDSLTIECEDAGGARLSLPASDRTIEDGGAMSAAFVSQTELEGTFRATVGPLPHAPAQVGVTVYASPQHHYRLVATPSSDAIRLTLRKTVGDMVVETSMSMATALAVELRIVATADTYSFSARPAAVEADAAVPDVGGRGDSSHDDSSRDDWVDVGTGQVRLLSAETSQTYSGARFGVFAVGGEARFTGVRWDPDNARR